MINPVQGYYTKVNNNPSKMDKKSSLLSRNFLQVGRRDAKKETVKKNAPVKNMKKFKTLKSIPSQEKMVKPLSFYKKKINSVTDLENIANNISIIVNYFLDNYPNQERVQVFFGRYGSFLSKNFIDVLLIMREFSDFSIFDFLQISTAYNETLSQKEIEDKRKMICIRNNILLSILIIAKELEVCEKEGEIDFEQKEPLFFDLRFLNPFIEKFKNLIIENDNKFQVSYEVEVFFFAILGFKDKSRIIKQKFNQYFKDFLVNCGVNKLNFNDFLSITMEKAKFCEYKDEEIVILRKILNNAAIRDFYYGLEFLMKDTEYCFILSEGRIWKNLGIYMEPYKVYNLWSMYEESIEEIRGTDLRETLSTEYEDKLKNINIKLLQYKTLKPQEQENLANNEEYTNLIYEKRNIMKEICLYNVTCLKELFVIFFQNELKGLVLFFFDEYKNTRGETKVPIDIYEICLDYDEDISIAILDRAVTVSTAKKWYMEISLVKKYFRLARRLLKFQVCRDCLNDSVPVSDEYTAILSKFQVYLKQQNFEKIKYKNGGEDLRIIEFIKEKNTLNSSIENIEGSTLKKDQDENLVKKIESEKINIPLKRKSKFTTDVMNIKKIFVDDEEETGVQSKYHFIK